MMQIRKTGLDVELANVDSIIVPAALLEEVREMARKAKHTHFIGAKYERNPDFVERPLATLADVLKDAMTGVPTGLEPNSRMRLTGEFIVTDNRDALEGQGVGGIVWVTGR